MDDDGVPMSVFAVERYLPALTLDGVREQVQREREVVGIRHLRTTYLRDDELCFSLFEAVSLDAVRRANERAGMSYERITEAIEVSNDDVDDTTSGSERP